MRESSLLTLTLYFISSQFAFSAPCSLAPPPTSVNINSTTPYPTGSETPASIACVYGFTPHTPGCRPQDAIFVPSGGWGVIAVTEGYDDPNALQELNAFSAQMGLSPMNECSSITTPSSQPCFATVYVTGTQPATAAGKGPADNPQKLLREHALDVEMAHAMAPNASIVMVEAPTFEQTDTLTAVSCASTVVTNMGGGVISNSWSIPEYAGETSNDVFFQTPGIVYVGSSGDILAPAHYPSVSPYLVSVGATEFTRDANGNFLKEVAWNEMDGAKGTSGGPSALEPRPAFQNSVMKIVGTHRGSPDVATIGHNIIFYTLENCTGSSPAACDANWFAGSGTSFSAPIMAGIINTAGSHAQSSQAELAIIYNGAQKNYHGYWHDIIEGNNGYPTLQGYDFVSGLGSPKGYLGK